MIYVLHSNCDKGKCVLLHQLQITRTKALNQNQMQPTQICIIVLPFRLDQHWQNSIPIYSRLNGTCNGTL